MSWLSDLLKDYPALSVAKERLALAEERYSHTEEENNRLKARITELEEQNAELQSQIPKKAVVELEELEINILKALAGVGNDGVSARDIAGHLGVNETTAEYYAEKLADEGYLHQSYAANMPVYYRLSQDGRGFLVKNGLI